MKKLKIIVSILAVVLISLSTSTTKSATAENQCDCYDCEILGPLPNILFDCVCMWEHGQCMGGEYECGMEWYCFLLGYTTTCLQCWCSCVPDPD